MAHDKSTRDDSKSGSDSGKSSSSLETDMALLASILTQPQNHGHAEDTDDPQVADLLRQLTTADGVAKSVEERLDGIIENLDLLLTALEKESGEQQSSEAAMLDKTKETPSA